MDAFFDIACSFLPAITENHNGITIDDLRGEIERQGDDFFGMVVAVIAVGDVA